MKHYEKTILAARLRDIYHKLDSKDTTPEETMKLSAEFDALAKKNHVDILIKIHFLNIKKDAKDTFKPYKSVGLFFRDLLAMPFYGIGNIFLVPHYVTRATISLFALFFIAPFKKNKRAYAAEVLSNSGLNFLAAGIALLRGATQIIATPLVMLRTILRLIITAVKGRPKFEDSESLKTLVKHKLDEKYPALDRRAVTKSILHKLEKAKGRGQRTQLNDADASNAEKAGKKVLAADDQLQPKVGRHIVIIPVGQSINPEQSKDAYVFDQNDQKLHFYDADGVAEEVEFKDGDAKTAFLNKMIQLRDQFIEKMTKLEYKRSEANATIFDELIGHTKGIKQVSKEEYQQQHFVKFRSYFKNAIQERETELSDLRKLRCKTQ